MASPRIDVLIPAYNAEATIESAVSSIQLQTVRDIRIHIVNDGSTDETRTILARLASGDPRIQVHNQPNGGIVDALNAGLAHCTAEMIARHDADDLAYPDRLERQIAYLDDHPDCIALGGSVRHINAEGEPTGSIGRAMPAGEADAYSVPCREPYIIHPFLMARRAAIEGIRGYRYVFHAEDSDLYWRLEEIGRLHNLPDLLGDYRLHDQSISGKSIQNGRIMAVCSQLAGLSARRRREGRADLVFEKTLLNRLGRASDITGMVAIAAELLEEAELAAFEEMVAAKLMELCAYRPYEPTVADCRFVRAVSERGFDHLPASQRALLIRQLSGSAARLMHDRHWREALELLPRRYYPQAIARLGVRAVRYRAAVARGRVLLPNMG